MEHRIGKIYTDYLSCAPNSFVKVLEIQACAAAKIDDSIAFTKRESFYRITAVFRIPESGQTIEPDRKVISSSSLAIQNPCLTFIQCHLDSTQLEKKERAYSSKFENRLFSASMRVGWEKTPSRRTVYGRSPIMAI